MVRARDSFAAVVPTKVELSTASLSLSFSVTVKRINQRTEEVAAHNPADWFIRRIISQSLCDNTFLISVSFLSCIPVFCMSTLEISVIDYNNSFQHRKFSEVP